MTRSAKKPRKTAPAIKPGRGKRLAAQTKSSNKPSKKVRVFISYAKADNPIAVALREEITDINRDRVECFLDSETIGSGEGWEKKLDDALNAADWLVCLYTGEQSDFCGYEVGVFTKGKGLAENSGQSRLVCMHDVADYPSLFRSHQNRYVELPPERIPPGEVFDETSFYQNSNLAKFFDDLCRYDELYVARDAAESQRQYQAIIRKAKRITEAFRAGRGNDIRTDTPTQLSVEVTIPGKAGEALTVIPDDAQVRGTFQSLGLFNVMPPMQGEQLPSTSWRDVKAACASPHSAHIPWIERLERDMLNAANGRALGESEATFLSKNKTYRAILFRHIVNWGGTQRFGIVFVETLPRQFVGDQNTSLILAGLVVASRFRFAYLEQPDRIEARFDDRVSDAEFEGHYRQFLYDLERMRQEAMELGLLDPTTFVNSFGPNRRGIAEGFLTQSAAARQTLERGLPPPGTTVGAGNRKSIKEAIMQFLKAMEVENSRFLKVAIQAYGDELEAQLRKGGR
jgi:TIR domain